MAVSAVTCFASGPQYFDTVIIDAGHGGSDRGGGPGQRIPESPYTLDTALRLQKALQQRGFKTVMTRTSDVFVSLPDRVRIGASYRNAVFVSVHYNSGPRSDAHGYETYYYRSDSFGLASRLHAAQLSSLNTDDRHVKRDPFMVLRNPSTPAVLCEGGFLTNPQEAATIQSASYRERWAQNIAGALFQQRRFGDPANLAAQPGVTTTHYASAGHARGRVSSRSSSASRHGSHTASRTGASHHSTSSHSRGSTKTSSAKHSSGKTTKSSRSKKSSHSSR